MVGQEGSSLFAQLKARRAEIEQAVLARIGAVPGAVDSVDGEDAEGLRQAISAGVSHGLTSVQRGEDWAGPIPTALFSRARQAARSGLTPEVVLRRYFVGYTVFGDFVVQAAGDGVPAGSPGLASVLRTQAALFERLVVSVMGEYTRERAHHRGPSEQRQLELVRKLLAAEPAAVGELVYEFDDWHVGATARGAGAAAALRDLARAADRRLLLIRPAKETIWAWLGGRQRIAVADIARHVPPGGPEDALLALGEPARGVEGWRLTHQQASAALDVCRRRAEGIVRYADVGLLASIEKDPLLASSLRQLYLAPLADGRDGGVALRETLRAYFTAGRNISSAASALGVSRQTVGNRLRAVEAKLGRTLESCTPEIEVALRLEGGGDLTGRANLSNT